MLTLMALVLKYDLQPDALSDGFGTEGEDGEEETEREDAEEQTSEEANDGF